MAYEGTEVDFKTGKVRATVMTSEQIAAAKAGEAVEAPVRAQLAADAIERDAAKLSAVVQYLVTHTNAEIMKYVKTEVNADNVTNLATAVAALQKIETLLGHLAVAVAVDARKVLR